MTKFTCEQARTAIESAIDHNAGTNADAQLNAHQIACIPTMTKPFFGQRQRIG